MAIDEERRLALYRKFEQVLGQSEAVTMMEYLPPVGWTDVARQGDLAALSATVKSDIDQLSASTRAQIAELRAEVKGDIAELRTELKGGIAELRTELSDLRVEMHDGFGAIRTDFASIIASQTRSMVLMLLGSVLTVAVIAFAARLG